MITLMKTNGNANSDDLSLANNVELKTYASINEKDMCQTTRISDLYFNDGVRRIDYVLVYRDLKFNAEERQKSEQNALKRRIFEVNMAKVVIIISFNSVY